MVPEARRFAAEGGKREQGEASVFDKKARADALAAPATVSGEASFEKATVDCAFTGTHNGKAEQGR